MKFKATRELYQIRKYPLQRFEGFQEIAMPAESKMLSVHEQRGKPILWAICPARTEVSDPKLRIVKRVIKSHWTGSIDRIAGDYLGTCVLDDGALVVHYFEMELPQ